MILDLHIHSRHSFDSLARPRDIVGAAKRKGLDGIAVTDHDTMAGGLEAREANNDQGFVVIVGAEICSSAGDIIGLFLEEEIEAREPLAVVAEIHRQGGIAVLPHPFRGHMLSEELVETVDVVEAFNPRCDREENRRAVELANKHGKPIVAGSDAHTIGEIGLARTVLPSADVRGGILGGKATVEARYAPCHAEALSQLIKAVKARQYREVPRRSASVLLRLLGLRRGRMEMH